MAINPELLLFMEPKEKPSKKPIIDELTKKMTASFRKAKIGCINNYAKIGQDYTFTIDGGWMGSHICSCGAGTHTDGGRDYLLNNEEMTNKHCIHYLAFHRNEIHKEQLERINKLNDGEEEPTNKEIKIPK